MGAIVVIERACEKACSAPVSSPLAAARLPRQRARASSAEPGPAVGDRGIELVEGALGVAKAPQAD